MAKNKSQGTTSGDVAAAFADGIKFASYKNTGKGNFNKLEPGGEIAGIFVSMRYRKIKDTRTREDKVIRVYSIRTAEGVAKVSGRALLDSCFDDVMDEHGGYTIVNNTASGSGIEWITNRPVKFLRGEDTETRQGDEMGTYEILVEE